MLQTEGKESEKGKGRKEAFDVLWVFAQSYNSSSLQLSVISIFLIPCSCIFTV